MVMNRRHRVVVGFHQGTHEVVSTFLHLRVGTLHGIELHGCAVTAGVYRRDGAAPETDAIVVTTDNDDVFAFLRLFLQAVAFLAVAHAAGEHDDLVVAVDLIGSLDVLLAAFNDGGIACRGLIFEGEHGTSDQRLTKLITEVGRTVGCFDKDLFRGLIEPFARSDLLLEVACGLPVVVFQTGVRSHVHRGAGDRP